MAKKKIKITSTGYLTAKSGIKGPILAPYYEELKTIRLLLAIDKANVIEVLPNGNEVTLTLTNYLNDNTGVTPEKKEDKKVKQEDKVEEPAEEVTPVADEEVAEEPAEEVTETEEKPNNNNNNQNVYKKNKHNKYNNNNAKADVTI